jgi:transcriptional regulator with XRE-family HTH domain
MESPDLKQEFRNLLKASGWSQAEAARQLCMTPSALSQIVRPNSTVKPSHVTLRLFKLLLLREDPDRLSACAETPQSPTPPARGEAWESELINALRRLPPTSRSQILTTFHTILAGWSRNQAPASYVKRHRRVA